MTLLMLYVRKAILLSESTIVLILLLNVSIFQGLHPRNLQSEKLSDDDDVPSAPPFCGATQEIKQDNETSPSRIPRTQHTTSSSDQFVRYVCFINVFSLKKCHPLVLVF